MTSKEIVNNLMQAQGVSNAEMAAKLNLTQAALWDRLNPKKTNNMTVKSSTKCSKCLITKLWQFPEKPVYRKEVLKLNDTLKLIETRTINDALVNGYYGKKEAWFTRDEIGSVLGYADPRQSIANIHNRHKERFSDKSVQINLICTDGKSYDTTVYNFKGVMEICRWSKQPKADMVMEALYDMAESVARTGFYSVLPDQELIDLLVKRQSENPTFLREAAVDLKSKKALEQLAQDAQLRELWKQRAELPLGEYKSKLDVICNGNFTLLSKEIKKYEKWYTAFKARKVDYSL